MGRNYSSSVLDRAVEAQGHQCPYCTLPFGSVVAYRGETVQTPVGDHFVPHSWSGATLEENLVASCQVCNAFKSGTHFESLEHVRRALLVTRMKRRIDTLFLPDVAITEDPDAWGRDYAAFLSGN